MGASGLGTTDIEVVDVNKDGTPDFILSNQKAPSMVYIGNPQGMEVDPASKALKLGPAFRLSANTFASLDVTVADLDGDTNMDIIIANYDAPNYVYYGDGNGGFDAEAPLGVESDPTTAVKVADLNGDDVLDILVANRDADNLIYLSPGRTPSRSKPTVIGAPEADWQYTRIAADWQFVRLSTQDVTVADFNGDLVPDIATGEDGSPDMLFIGDGSGDFSMVKPLPIGPRAGPGWYESADVGNLRTTWGQYLGERDDTVSITALDADGDEDMDLVVGLRDMTAKVYFNDGAGLFSHKTPLGSPYPNGPEPVGKTAADSLGIAVPVDLNGDTYPDIVTGVDVLLNPGTGDFSNVVRTPYWDTAKRGSAPIAVVGVDIDMDGDIDLVVSPAASDTKYVLYNPGSGLVATDKALNGWWGDPEGMVPLGTPAAETTTMAAMDVDGDGDMDLFLGNEGGEIQIWLNPGNAAPPARGRTFTLEVRGAMDIALADVTGDGFDDVVVSDGSSFRVIKNPNTKEDGVLQVLQNAEDKWQMASVKSPVLGDCRQVEVYDVNNDGFVDIVTGSSTKIMIHYGSEGTEVDGDYASAETDDVGTEYFSNNFPGYATGEKFETLQLQVADVDGDGWADIAASFSSGFSLHKRLFYGKRNANGETSALLASWPETEGSRFGPEKEDLWKVTSLHLVDLNLDGNLDLLYAAKGTGDSGGSGGSGTYVAIGKSTGPLVFDAAAIAAQKLRLSALPFPEEGGQWTIKNIDVNVSPPDHNHPYAGTTNSECRNPADNFYPVQTRIDIDFPIIPCHKKDLKDCILLDPITALAHTIDNNKNEGMVSCSYTVDMHRQCTQGSTLATALQRSGGALS